MLNFLKSSLKPDFKVIKSDYQKNKDSTFFKPSGLCIFCGNQGSGKTISMMNFFYNIHDNYPLSVVCSNLQLKDMIQVSCPKDFSFLKMKLSSIRKHNRLVADKKRKKFAYINYHSADDLALILSYVKNGHFGVIILADELHTLYNNLGSKNVPIDVITEVTQARKNKTLMLAAAQDFETVAITFRRQTRYIIDCDTLFGCYTRNFVYKGSSIRLNANNNYEVNYISKISFFHTLKLRNSFDTYERVIQAVDSLPNLDEYKNFKFIKKNKKTFGLF